VSPIDCHPIPPFDAVLFDMDGLLLDSELIALQAMQAAALEQGIDMPAELRFQMIGMPADGCRQLVADRYGSAVAIEPLFAAATRHLEAYVQAGQLQLKPGVEAMLAVLDRLRVPRAVATSSGRRRAHHHLQVTGIFDRMQAVVTRDDVARGKPYPDLFLEAARRLGVPPARCLAFEDSYNGVRAAAAAGVPVIMVPDLLQATPEMHAVALRLFGSLHEVLPCISEREPLPLAAGAG
jgi:HAD superfamily hydrolase (TIGR01509 family)